VKAVLEPSAFLALCHCMGLPVWAESTSGCSLSQSADSMAVFHAEAEANLPTALRFLVHPALSGWFNGASKDAIILGPMCG